MLPWVVANLTPVVRSHQRSVHIIAAYQLEKEKVGTDHLNKEPQLNRLVTFTHHLPVESKDTAGFYSPHKVVCIKKTSVILFI
jgi:hypothetical protein